MTINKEIVFDLLSFIKNSENLHIEKFTKQVRARYPEIDTRILIDHLERLNSYIKFENNIVSLTIFGYKFLRKYNRKVKIENFYTWSTFLKNIFWILSFIISILLNVYFILKIIGVL